MKPTTKHILFTMLALAFLPAACAPAQVAAPTQDPALVQQQIQQAVALTVAAQNAQATEQQALIVPSNTPLPTQTLAEPPTLTPQPPTATPFVIVPPTNTAVSSSSGSGSGPIVKPDYACTVLNRKPADKTRFNRNKVFEIKWTIVNTGTRTMRKGLDVKFFSGTDMSTVSRVELPELKPGESYVVNLDAKSPDKFGTYTMTWTVEGQLCFPYTIIIVE
jgi:hypothetical protein